MTRRYVVAAVRSDGSLVLVFQTVHATAESARQYAAAQTIDGVPAIVFELTPVTGEAA
jgi:hypothetical protein